MIRINDQEGLTETAFGHSDILLGSQPQVGPMTRPEPDARTLMLDAEDLSFAKEQCICTNLTFYVS